MSNALVKHDSPMSQLASRFSIEPDKLMAVLRGTVIKPDSRGRQATNEEVAAFAIVANQYGLNPFTREIHAFTSGEKGVVPIVGIDGWTHIVNGQDSFNGCKFDPCDGPDGKPISMTCSIYKKGMDNPVTVTEYFKECYRPTIPWNTMPHRMLRHKAFMQAARYAFGLSGIFDEDEGRDILNNEGAQERHVNDTTASRTENLLERLKKAIPVEAVVSEPEVAVTEPTQEPTPEHTPSEQVEDKQDHEPEEQDEDENTVTGILEKIAKKEFTSGTKYGCLVGGEWYSTFDKEIGEYAEGLKGQNVRIEFEFDKSGKYRNIKSIEAV